MKIQQGKREYLGSRRVAKQLSTTYFNLAMSQLGEDEAMC